MWRTIYTVCSYAFTYISVPVLIFFTILAWLNQVLMGICTCKGRLDGKVAVVTGSNTGMGYETALELAKRGCRVYLACRENVSSEPDPEQTAAEMARIAENPKVHFLPLDVSLMASIKKFAIAFGRAEDRLDILVNNAGILGRGTDKKETSEGVEIVTATNYLGPFMLTKLLLPLMRKVNGRVINISSISNIWAHGYDFDDLNVSRTFPDYAYLGARIYARTKLYLAMFSKELSVREPSISSMSVSPGVARTMISRDFFGDAAARAIVASPGALLRVFSAALLKDSWQGAQTAICLCVEPEVKSGSHYADCRADGGWLAPVVWRDADRRRLWSRTEELLEKTLAKSKD